MTDDYLELVEGARDALFDLLMATEPGTGMRLHAAYAELKRAAEREVPRWTDEVSPQERERQVLSVLSEHRLTIRELTERLDAELEARVYESHVRACVMRLFAARELDRKPEPGLKGRPRFRYFKRTRLEGPIADLERALQEEPF